ncbi:unnamed protein product [Phaedon cochleariae]|uniref:Endonuclease-reverse transcriptase n=1 Tax=Phaedon cochleariae TaxID=80249 RepID=A0A9N9X6G0_PHACE|nr:unnamed protein product [Phaedon cochleariae]
MAPRTVKGEDELQVAVKSLVTKLCSSDEFITQLTATITETIGEKYTKELQMLRKENKMISEKLKTQEETIMLLSERQEKQEQIFRSRNIRFYGVPEQDSENSMELIKDICIRKMNLKVDDSCFESCYRIGKKGTNATRPIMLKCSTNFLKNLVYKNKRHLKNTRIVIREDLTDEQLKIVKESLKKVGATGRVWTNSGNIFIKSSEDGQVRKINKLEDLERL